jgi:hypothetical protein
LRASTVEIAHAEGMTMNTLPIRKILLALGSMALLAACDGSGGAGTGLTMLPSGAQTGTPSAPTPTSGPFDVYVREHPGGSPIDGASVTVTVAGLQYRATSNALGVATFASLPRGDVVMTVEADGYDTPTFPIFLGSDPLEIWLKEEGWWTVGRPIVLGTRTVERASDGSAMTFSIDVAVIGPDSQALQTLTSADFTIGSVDCGWGGPRDCASDAAGNATGIDGVFLWDGGVNFLGLQPPTARQPYVVSVLAERSNRVTDWDARAPALKSFFSSVGGNDMVGLSSAQVENGVATLTSLGPFTSDGGTYAAAIDALAQPAGDQPSLPGDIAESIHGVAEARANIGYATDATVLLLGAPAVMDEADIAAAVTLARQLGVHISDVGDNYAYPAVRTGGFVAPIDDPRQLAMVFGAMDQLLAGTLPFYRMEFRLEGLVPGTFQPGGNARVRFVTHVPTSLKHGDLWTLVDVAIP